MDFDARPVNAGNPWNRVPKAAPATSSAFEVLRPHPASSIAKLEAFGMLFAVTAVFVQGELSSGPASQRRNAAYLQQVTSSGEYPRLGELLAGPPAAPGDSDRYAELIRRILTGLLGHAT